MKLFIIRHGETEENAKDFMMGQLDGALSEKGKKQADLLGKRFSNEKIDYIYASDLQRTKDTVLGILRCNTVPVIYDKLLRETNLGEFQGRPRSDFFRARIENPSPYWRPKGGENFYDIKRRVRKFLKYLSENHSESDKIVLVTHGGWKNVLFSHLLGIPREKAFDIFFENTAVSIINLLQNGKCVISQINCTKHL